MAKNLANYDLDKFEDDAEFEQIKKRGQDKSNQRQKKSKHRDNYVDPSSIDWDTDIKRDRD